MLIFNILDLFHNFAMQIDYPIRELHYLGNSILGYKVYLMY